MALSSVSACAILTSGQVQCSSFLFKNVDADGFVAYEFQGHPQIVRMADGNQLQEVKSLTIGEGPDHDTYCVVPENQEALCWGKDLLNRRQTLQFGNWLHPQRIFSGRKVEQLAVTDREICELDKEGAVFCQGAALCMDSTDFTAETLAAAIPVALPAPARWISSRSIGKYPQPSPSAQ